MQLDQLAEALRSHALDDDLDNAWTITVNGETAVIVEAGTQQVYDDARAAYEGAEALLAAIGQDGHAPIVRSIGAVSPGPGGGEEGGYRGVLRVTFPGSRY